MLIIIFTESVSIRINMVFEARWFLTPPPEKNLRRKKKLQTGSRVDFSESPEPHE